MRNGQKKNTIGGKRTGYVRDVGKEKQIMGIKLAEYAGKNAMKTEGKGEAPMTGRKDAKKGSAFSVIIQLSRDTRFVKNIIR